MTDQELIRRVAVEVMGWSYSPYSYTTNEYEQRTLFYSDKIPLSEKDNPVMETWNPLTNYNHTMLVIENMRRLEYEIDIRTYGKENWYVHFFGQGKHGTSFDQTNLGHAVCLAALKAVEEGK